MIYLIGYCSSAPLNSSLTTLLISHLLVSSVEIIQKGEPRFILIKVIDLIVMIVEVLIVSKNALAI